MPSTLRNDNRRAMTLARISAAWDKASDLRLAELLLVSLSPAQVANFSHVQDMLRSPGANAPSDDRRANTLATIAMAWDKAADLRLGQLLLLALSPAQVANFSRIKDVDLASAVDRFARTREP